MKRLTLLIIGTVITMVLFSHCQKIPQSGSVNVPEIPFEKLSDYHFFTGNLARLEPNERVLPYDLNSPLFTDYAHKARFVWMPPGSSADYTLNDVLDFPPQTVLIKNFYYLADERAANSERRIIETRLLINRGDNWEAIGYVWNDEQTEAYRTLVGAVQEVSWTNQSGMPQTVNYIVPNKNQCKNCHLANEQQVPIGPKVRNLNKPFTYQDGTTKNQLEKWAEIGYLSGFVPQADHPSVAVWNDSTSGSLHERALAYLDINCAHCHKKNGAANTSGLLLDVNTKMDMSRGIYKATVSAGAGTGGHQYSIVPGHPETSVMIYRMNSTDPGAMMPELGRTSVHTEGVALIAEWIEMMPEDKLVMTPNQH